MFVELQTLSVPGLGALSQSDRASQKLAPTWIEQTFKRRECAKFIPSARDKHRCGCGRSLNSHRLISESDCGDPLGGTLERWTIQRSTVVAETDAFGTIEFQGGPHPTKAQYVRLGFDSEPSDILELFRKVWGIKPPKLVITVHGGIANFDLQPKLARVFRKGLLKAAKTTGAWIITSGINIGVVRQVAAALTDGMSNRSSSKSKIVTIGIAPWGLLKKRDELIGKERTVAYHPRAFSPKGKFTVLNDKHNYFLLVDNGTVGRYGADIILRKRLEEYISNQSIGANAYKRAGKRIPVVCVILEGGQCTIRSVLDYVTNQPPVPVVVCDGSGRAADLLAFTYNHTSAAQGLNHGVKEQLLSLVMEVFNCREEDAHNTVSELQLCVRKRNLITVFRLGEDSQADVDHSILTALLKGQGNLAPANQLSLALAWNRVDIARSEIFVLGTDWPVGSLDAAMMEALVEDRVDFVKLLLENGVSMERFLTIQRLEELYNTERGPPNTLKGTLRSLLGSKGPITLKDIGLMMEKLMGSAYVARYCSREFTIKYNLWRQFRARIAAGDLRHPDRIRSSHRIHKEEDETIHNGGLLSGEPDFAYPFNELLVWAVLTKRQEMARCMWHHGEEALAKALVAAQLYRAMAHEAADDQLDLEIRSELTRNSLEFKRVGLELLEHCYHADRSAALRLLTYELRNWGGQTCLSLGVISGHKELIAHTVSQMLLGDLWHGGLSIRKSSNFKVIMGLLLPPLILRLDFKTKDELLLQPQTAEEHAEEMREWDGSDSSESSVSSPGASDGEEDGDDAEGGQRKRRPSFVHRARSGSRIWRAASNLSINSVIRGRTSISPPKSDPVHRKSGATPDMDANPIRRFLRTASLRTLGRWSFRTREAVERKRSIRPGDRNVVFATNSLPLAAHHDAADVKSLSLNTSVEEIKKKRILSIRRKLYEFYVAPITTFWFFTLSYLFFLCTFSYTVLVKTPPDIKWQEVFIAAYVLTLGFNMLCKILVLEPRGIGQKFRLWLGRGWNVVRSLAVISYLLCFGLRLSPDPHTREVGRVGLSVNIILWYIQLLEIMMVNADLGLYMTMIMKMVVKAAGILMILLVVLTAFGVAWQALRFQNEDWHWQLLRNVFYKPYFMLYGEVYAGEIDECGDDGENCITGVWLAPAVMFLFLLVANIVLINLMIAVFNSIFASMNAQSQQLWRFGRYFQVMEYEASPPFPPPFILFCDLYRLGKLARRWHRQRKGLQPPNRIDFSLTGSILSLPNLSQLREGNLLKLFLSDEDIERIHDFEEECMDDLHQEKQARKFGSQEEKVAKTNDRVEYISMKMSDLVTKESSTRNSVQELEKKLTLLEAQIENLNNELVHKEELFDKVEQLQTSLRKIDNRMSTQRPKSPGHGSAPDIASGSGTELRRRRTPTSPQPMTNLSLIRHPKAPALASFHLGGDETSLPVQEDVAGPSAASTPKAPSAKSPLRRLASVQGTEEEDEEVTPSLLRRRMGHKRSIGGEWDDVELGKLVGSRSSSPTKSVGSHHSGTIERARSVPTDTLATSQARHSYPGKLAASSNGGKPSLHTLNSCPAGGSPKLSVGAMSLPRPRRNDEYTSITDRIQVYVHPSDSLALEESAAGRLSLIKEESGSALSLQPNPHFGDDAAKLSFAIDQNEVLKEFEETSSRITAGLIGGRIRKESARFDLVGGPSALQASHEELKDMGLHDVDVNDYLAVLEGAPLSHSSSQESLSSNKMEDEDGFQQINECLIAAAHSRQGSNISTVKEASKEPTPLHSLLSSPLTSPTGAKASHLFAFDAESLRTYVESKEAAEKSLQPRRHSEDDEC